VQASAQVAPLGYPVRVIPEHYLVTLRDGTADASDLARQLTAVPGVRVSHVYRHTIRGFAARLPAAAVAALARNPNVQAVEPDQVVSLWQTFQDQAVWGLDRSDQRTLPLDTRYGYTLDGSGVEVFVVDTGIRSSHQELEGRVSGGFSSFQDGVTEDCNGHGTHVAGTVAGATWGVAKAARVSPVRVLDCGGSGSWSGVIAGVDWVVGQAVHGGRKPAVINMSLGGGASSTVDAAVQRAVSAGVVVVVAAGNSKTDACKSSPAREPSAITVGASTVADAQASYSNYGRCLDLYAPGSGIRSAWYTSDTAYADLNGTSMASPHVAGAVALFLQADPGASPGAVTRRLLDGATSGVLRSLGQGSPDRLLYALAAGEPPPPDQTVFVAQIDGMAESVKSGWRAHADVSVRYMDSSQPVAGATVTGSFSPGGTYYCTTSAAGTCRLSSANLNSKTLSTTFSLVSAAGDGLTYSGLSNTVNSVVIRKP
jgi:subtilisin family serine protease